MKSRMPKAVCVVGATLLTPVGFVLVVGAIAAIAYGGVLMAQGFFSNAILLYVLIGLTSLMSIRFIVLLAQGWYQAYHALFDKCCNHWHSND
jgi:membrane protein implicated in regulation of membrane protease activity